MVRRLIHLNGLATISVVLYHASAWGFIALIFWTNRYRSVAVPDFSRVGGLDYFALRIIEQIVIFAIPSFLFISGYFVAVATGKYQETIGWNVILTRIKNLVIPYLVWTGLILTLKLLQGQTFSVLETAEIILTGGIEPPFYYVPVLVQLYLLSPFIVPMARVRWRPVLILTGLVQLIAVGMQYFYVLQIPFVGSSFLRFLSEGWLFPAHIFFFAFGIVTGFQLNKFKRWLQQYKKIFILGIIVFFVLGVAEWEMLYHASGREWIAPFPTIIDDLYAAAFLLAYLAYENLKLPFTDTLAYLGSKSYGIYLVHSPVLEYTSRVVYHVAPMILAFQFVFQPILWLAGLGIPLLLMAIVNRLPIRRFYSYLFG